MASRSWLLCLTLVLACGEDRPRPISESSSPTGLPPAGGGGQGNSAGAPGNPATGAFYNVGDTLDPALSWQGYAEGSDELGTISLADYHDPTGTLGVRAILLTEGQADCAPCVAEAKDLTAKLAGKWKDKGIKIIQLLVSDALGKPASSFVAFTWKNKVNASWAVGLDPRFTFAQNGSNPYPVQVIIDPRTLTIVDRIEGYRAELPEVEALAEKNQ